MVGIILIIIAIIVLAWAIRREIVKGYSSISFREAMDLTELPVITMNSNGIKINMLLDTGSNSSYIGASVIEKLNYTEVEGTNTTYGFGGAITNSKCCSLKLGYKKLEFEDDFIIMDSDSVFDAIKSTYGVQVHGIIGSRFFEKYSYAIDFKDFIAYIR